jgi:pre-mRNA-splicing factor CWC22
LRHYFSAQRFCFIDQQYATLFDETFMKQYSTIHRLETNKLRNVAKFFSHLLHTVRRCKLKRADSAWFQCLNSV